MELAVTSSLRTQNQGLRIRETHVPGIYMVSLLLYAASNLSLCNLTYSLREGITFGMLVDKIIAAGMHKFCFLPYTEAGKWKGCSDHVYIHFVHFPISKTILHQQIKEILRIGYNHHNWWQLVMMVQEYRRSNHNAISVITRHCQTHNSPWSSQLATIWYLILTYHNVDAKFSVHPIAFHIIKTFICIS